MPQEYNVPDWFTPEYRKAMGVVLDELDYAFQLSLTTDEVLRYIEDHETDGPRSQREVERTRIIWWGDSFNVGYMALFYAPPHIYRHLFPSAARAAVEIHPRKPSAAEESALPYTLAKSLSVEHSRPERVHQIRVSFSAEEIKVIASVLEAPSLRNDECGAVAANALQDYWLKHS